MTRKKVWMPVPRKPARPKVPDEFKLEVKWTTDEFVESFLKPNFIHPPPKDSEWNYVVDIFTKWHQRFFYFCSTYRCPFPNRTSEFFESRFARLEFVGNRKFNVAYMRHTGQWWEIFKGFTVDQCLAEIKENILLQPPV